jgi:hypothetical protein
MACQQSIDPFKQKRESELVRMARFALRTLVALLGRKPGQLRAAMP